jgi:hypothetical protein
MTPERLRPLAVSDPRATQHLEPLWLQSDSVHWTSLTPLRYLIPERLIPFKTLILLLWPPKATLSRNYSDPFTTLTDPESDSVLLTTLTSKHPWPQSDFVPWTYYPMATLNSFTSVHERLCPLNLSGLVVLISLTPESHCPLNDSDPCRVTLCPLNDSDS